MGLRFRRPQRTWAQRATRDDVLAAYRLLLRRPPDPEGLAHFERLVREGIELDHLVSLFVESDEYRRRVAAGSSAEDVVDVDLGGYVVCVRPSEPDFGRGIAQTADYEPHLRRALGGLLQEGQTFLDIGANVGALAFLAATVVGETGTVLAVEPYPDNVQLLYAGIVRNGFPNVRVLPFAASDRPGGVVSLTGGTSNAYVVPARTPREYEAFAQTVVLDDELDGLSSLDVVKIDVEGHEPAALRGCAGLLRRHRPTLVTEFNPRCLRDHAGVEPGDYATQLFGLYERLDVLTPFGDAASFTGADELLRFWARRDRELTDRGQLPDGMLHLDIVASSR
jgi:FkbM family methyltransferase